MSEREIIEKRGNEAVRKLRLQKLQKGIPFYDQFKGAASRSMLS